MPSLPIQPVLAALRRHRLAMLLITVEIALACAVLCNACFLIVNRVQQTRLVSGVDEASLAQVALSGFDPAKASDINARVLDGVRRIPGVESISVINAVPFGDHAGTAGITLEPASQKPVGVIDFYVAGPGAFEAMGLHVVAGSPLRPDDFPPMVDFTPADASVLITRALAEHLWPGADPLGKEFWCDKRHFRVSGVLEHLARPGGGEGSVVTREWSVFLQAQPGQHLAGTYLLRAAPDQLQGALREVRTRMATIVPDAVLVTASTRTVGELRDSYFRDDRLMAGLLVGVICALLLVTALGIVGLTSFWVQQRRKQIGIRRAIGATRADILAYFQTENFLIVSGGIALGMVMAFGLNLALMSYYELPHLPLPYLPAGALVLWVLGQLAVLGPALRAAAVPPVVATRSV